MRKRILQVLKRRGVSEEKLEEIEEIIADYSDIEKIAIWRNKFRSEEKKRFKAEEKLLLQKNKVEMLEKKLKSIKLPKEEKKKKEKLFKKTDLF